MAWPTRPRCLCFDAWAVSAGPHARLRRYRSTDAPYGLTGVQSFVCDFCMVVVAKGRIFLRGQTGLGLDRTMVGLNDPAAQARQAIENVRVLLADAGADLSHAVRLVTYVTDRAYLAPVLDVVRPAFADAPVAGTELGGEGFGGPGSLLMEIDVHAVLPS